MCSTHFYALGLRSPGPIRDWEAPCPEGVGPNVVAMSVLLGAGGQVPYATADDLQSAILGLQEVWELDEPEATIAGLVLLSRLVPCDVSGVTWLNTSRGEIVTQTWPEGAFPRRLHREPAPLAAPPLGPYLAERGYSALRLSDVLDDSQWRAHPIRHATAEVNNNVGGPLERMLGWGFTTAEGVVGYAANRLGRDFSLRDRDVLGLLAPGLARHRRRLIELAAIRALLANQSGGALQHAVVLDPTGRVEQSWGDGERLYEHLTSHRGATQAPDEVASTAEAPDLPAGYKLLILKAPAVRLTPRELLILDLSSRGYTATGVSRRVDSSPRTVHKHLERIYRKLGVNDRASAVRIALTTGLFGRNETTRGN